MLCDCIQEFICALICNVLVFNNLFVLCYFIAFKNFYFDMLFYCIREFIFTLICYVIVFKNLFLL